MQQKLAVVALLAATLTGAEIKPEKYLAHIKYLASPQLKGRLTGTAELEQAAAYIAKQFHKAGLKPVGGSYLQEFEVTARTAPGRGSSLAIVFGQRMVQLRENRDFIPSSLSTNGETVGPMVFAGYGISSPDNRYDDYEKIDARGKIVIVMRNAPAKFDGSQGDFAGKVANAKLHGAAAVLLVDDKIEKFTPSMGTEDFGLLVAQITASEAEQVLGRDLGALVKKIDADQKPQSFDLPAGDSAKLAIDVVREQQTVHNVAGYLPGLSNEYVIIGAHYDHLGLGQQYSLAPSLAGTVHPGADDNASGTAGVIELAHALAASGKHERGFLFLCFAGEEEGLLGSAYYVNHPVMPLSAAAAMINMDMIGRLRDHKIYVGGVGTGSSFKPLVEKAAQDSGLSDDLSEAGGYGASDHTSFTTKGVPTLFFFSGLHGDYHKPSDTWDKIDADEAVKVLEEVQEVAMALADAKDRPEFVRVAPPAHSGTVAGLGGGSGYGPYFGSIPDFGGPAKGVRFSDVRDDSPAAKAGFKAGDVMVGFDGKTIDNLYDFTYALRQHKPGDTVTVKVLRDGKPVEAQVELTKRP